MAWTGDDAIVHELESAARRALDWIDTYGDHDGDGFVEYLRRGSHGIDNQNWKDSWNSMVFHDGSLAHAPIAPVEVQGYVYDAKLRIAELARRVWGDEETAARLEREAATLRDRFDAAFWLEERGWYALGLDRTSARSTPSPRTWATCCGAASSPPSASSASSSG